MRGSIALVLFIVVALVAAAAGFQAGVMSNIGANGVGLYWLWGFPHFGGLLFLLLVIGLLVFAFGGRRRHWGGRGYWGPGYGPMNDPGDPRRQWIADAHRRLHEEEARRSSDPSAGSGTPGDRPPAG